MQHNHKNGFLVSCNSNAVFPRLTHPRYHNTSNHFIPAKINSRDNSMPGICNSSAVSSLLVSIAAKIGCFRSVLNPFKRAPPDSASYHIKLLPQVLLTLKSFLQFQCSSLSKNSEQDKRFGVVWKECKTVGETFSYLHNSAIPMQSFKSLGTFPNK